MNRTHWILSGLLLVQILLLLLAGATFTGGNGTAAARPLLPELESFDAVRLRIDGADESSVELELKDGAWVLPEAGGFPVNGTKVTKLLSDLADLKVRRPVVTSSRYHDTLKVSGDEHERRLKVWDEPAGDPSVELLVGTSPNYRISHARRGDEENVYEVMGLSAFDLNAGADAWIEKKFVDVPSDDVIRLNVTNEHGSFSLDKKAGEWTLGTSSGSAPEGKTLSQTEVDSLVRAFSSVYMAEPVGAVDAAAHGLAEPAATVEIVRGREPEPPAATDEAGEEEVAAGDVDTAGEMIAGEDATSEAAALPAAPVEAEMVEMETITLKIGGEMDAESGKRYATRSGFPFTVTLNKFDAERATAKKLEDLYTE
jgi:hypothetical protein